MPIRLRCPDCKAKLSVATRKSGQTIKCPGCKAEIVVPVVESKKQEPAAETPAEKPVEKPKAKEKQLPAAVGAPAPAVDLPTYDQLWGDDEPEEDDEDGLTLSSKGDQVEEMDLTPMVDVTFLLLIFFMITASFSIQKVVSSSPPAPNEDGASQQINQKNENEAIIKLEIDENDQMYLETNPVASPDDLEAALQREMLNKDTKQLEITLHYLASHEVLIQVRDSATRAGIDQIIRKIEPGTKPGG